MLTALKFGVSVGLVVAAFETWKRRNAVPGEAWATSIKMGLTNTTTLGAASAAAVAGLIL